MNQPIKRVLVTGVFDILHQEHQLFLEKAKALGGELWVGLESDTRVKQIKGPDRPINNQDVRQQNLEALGIADHVFILPEQFSQPADHERLIAELKPDVLAVSSHTDHLDKKQALLAKFGGQVVIVHQHNPAVSTTQLLSAHKPA